MNESYRLFFDFQPPKTIFAQTGLGFLRFHYQTPSAETEIRRGRSGKQPHRGHGGKSPDHRSRADGHGLRLEACWESLIGVASNHNSRLRPMADDLALKLLPQINAAFITQLSRRFAI